MASLAALIGACGVTADEGMGGREVLVQIEGAYDASTNRFSISAIDEARGLIAVSPTGGGGGAALGATIVLEQLALRNKPECAAADVCLDMRMRSASKDRAVRGAWMELSSISVSTVRGVSDRLVPAGVSKRYGAWAHGDIAPSGNADRTWRFTSSKGQSFRFTGRILATRIDSVAPANPRLALTPIGGPLHVTGTLATGAALDADCASACEYEMLAGSPVSLKSAQPAKYRWMTATGPFACEDVVHFSYDDELNQISSKLVECELAAINADVAQSLTWSADPIPDVQDRTLTLHAVNSEMNVNVYGFYDENTGAYAVDEWFYCPDGATCVFPIRRGLDIDAYSSQPGFTFYAETTAENISCDVWSTADLINCWMPDNQADVSISIDWIQDPDLTDPGDDDGWCSPLDWWC